MASIALEWNWINWEKGFIWGENVLPQLEALGIHEESLDRSVYVIRLNVPFAIKYPKNSSPVLYIGEGNFKSRLSSHKNIWIPELWELIQEFGLTVGVALPRVRNNSCAYKDVEADLILKFYDMYGSAPLNNKQLEYPKILHEYDQKELKIALTPGQGVKYKWSIEPMKANPFYEVFHKTHHSSITV